MVVTIDGRDTINCKVTIVLCKQGTGLHSERKKEYLTISPKKRKKINE